MLVKFSPFDFLRRVHNRNLLRQPVLVRLFADDFDVVSAAGSFSFPTGLPRSFTSGSSLSGVGAILVFQYQRLTVSVQLHRKPTDQLNRVLHARKRSIREAVMQ